MSVVSMKQLLEAGVHFGHQTRRWNPKMKPYIFGARNGIYIIDLQKTVRHFRDAYRFVRELAGRDGVILFVGTKKQAQEAVEEEARRCGMPFLNQRWLGGLLTNFETIKKSLGRLKKFDAMSDSGNYGKLTKKEILSITKEQDKLNKTLSGIKEMSRLPDAIFVIDPNREEIGVKEARRLGIPVVAVVDTNCNPDDVDWIIPGNDDAIRAIRLFAAKIADAVIEGRQAVGAAEMSATLPRASESAIPAEDLAAKGDESGGEAQA